MRLRKLASRLKRHLPLPQAIDFAAHQHDTAAASAATRRCQLCVQLRHPPLHAVKGRLRRDVVQQQRRLRPSEVLR